MNTIVLPLAAREFEQRRIDKLLHAHGLLYNATISELVERAEAYHADQDKIDQSKLTRKAYYSRLNQLQKQHGLRRYDTYSIGAEIWQRSKNQLYDGKLVQSTCERAWRASQDYMKRRTSKPSYKNPHQLDSVTSNGNLQNLRLSRRSSDAPKDLSELHAIEVLWANRALDKKHRLRIRIDWEALSRPRREWLIDNYGRIKQVGLTRKWVRGQRKHYVAITLDCPAYRNPAALARLSSKTGRTLAIDTGPRVSRAVDSDGSRHEFKVCGAEEGRLRRVSRRIASLQRRLDRSNRANSPGSYEADGTLKEGARIRNPSRRAARYRSAIRELHRKQREQRKQAVLGLARRIFERYDTVLMEACSYRAWQRRYGRVMRYHTPGLFQALLQSEAERYGKEVRLLPLSYAFSQSCVCGNRVKKSLSERVHSCADPDCVTHGREYDRDEFSATLMLLTHFLDLAPDDLHSGAVTSMLGSPGKVDIETLLNLPAANTSSRQPDPRASYSTEAHSPGLV